jgi:iron-sulfur cluster assembly accessory protein
MTITLTPSAITHIKKMLINRGENPAFRLSVKKTGCSGYMYVPEIVNIKKESDVDMSVLDVLVYIDKTSLPMLEGTVVDFVVKNLGMSHWVFNNPNADSMCGCGESFNLKKHERSE